jgi:hypothetical protein
MDTRHNSRGTKEEIFKPVAPQDTMRHGHSLMFYTNINKRKGGEPKRFIVTNKSGERRSYLTMKDSTRWMDTI